LNEVGKKSSVKPNMEANSTHGFAKITQDHNTVSYKTSQSADMQVKVNHLVAASFFRATFATTSNVFFKHRHNL